MVADVYPCSRGACSLGRLIRAPSCGDPCSGGVYLEIEISADSYRWPVRPWVDPDARWEESALLPPSDTTRVRPRTTNLDEVVNGILYVLRGGIPCRKRPTSAGPGVPADVSRRNLDSGSGPV